MVDVESPAARALRALQKLDCATDYTPGGARQLLIEAQDALGTILGLECLGDREDPPFGYSHNGGTCRIHEWLVDADYDEVEAVAS